MFLSKRNKPSIVIRTALIILDLLLNTPSIYLSKNLDAFTKSIPIPINTAPSPRLNMRTSRNPSVALPPAIVDDRSEEHTSELQSQSNLVCRLLLEKKKK